MFFAQAVDAIIENRRALIDSGAEAPRDLLTLLLSAKDPENGRGMSDEDMRANIVTFILAGHETTANASDLDRSICSPNRPNGANGRRPKRIRRSIADGRPRPRDARSLRAVFEEAMRLYPPAAMLSSSGDRRRRTRGRAYSRPAR